jgi:hypothetical protein
MFFVEKDVEWRCYADYALRMDACENMLKTLKEQYPINADYNKILIGHVKLGK